VRLLLVIALVGCAPVVDLPYASTVYLPPIPTGPPSPNPDGPCLQETGWRKSKHLWKRGIEQRSLSEATADDPPAHAIARRADRLGRAGLVVTLLGMGTIMAGYFTLLANLTSQSAPQLTAGGATLASGVALFASGIVMDVRAGPIRRAAIAEYNARCR
jgi:hypothetical protein